MRRRRSTPGGRSRRAPGSRRRGDTGSRSRRAPGSGRRRGSRRGEKCWETNYDFDIDPSIVFAGVSFLPPTITTRFYFCFSDYVASLVNGRWRGRVGFSIRASGVTVLHPEIPFGVEMRRLQKANQSDEGLHDFANQSDQGLEDEFEHFAPSVEARSVHFRDGDAVHHQVLDAAAKELKALHHDSDPKDELQLFSMDFDSMPETETSISSMQLMSMRNPEQDLRSGQGLDASLRLGFFQMRLRSFLSAGNLKMSLGIKVGSLVDQKAETTIVNFKGMINGLECIETEAKSALLKAWQKFTARL